MSIKIPKELVLDNVPLEERTKEQLIYTVKTIERTKELQAKAMLSTHNAKMEELKMHCKAVDDVNVKLRCCGNCACYNQENNYTVGKCSETNTQIEGNNICNKWRIVE